MCMTDNIREIMNNFMQTSDLLFVSERDFQVSLAIELKNELEGCEVICEYPTISYVEYCASDCKTDFGKKGKENGTKAYIDIVVIKDNNKYPIELKYRTCDLGKEIKGVRLSDQKAYDDGCYGFLRDICRIEEFVSNKKDVISGFAIFLTNDKKYLNEYFGMKDERSYDPFWIGKHDNKEGSCGPTFIEGGTVARVNGKYRKLELPKEIESYEWKNWEENEDCQYLVMEIKKNNIDSL